MFLADVVIPKLPVDPGAYPRWMVILAGTLAVVVALWIGAKLLKWSLWLLLVLVFLGGIGWAAWEFLH